MYKQLQQQDLIFITETLKPAHLDDGLLQMDASWIETALNDKRLFQRLMQDEQTMLCVSPWLLFSVLLRQTQRDLAQESFTSEQRSRQKIVLFDTEQVIKLLEQASIRDYLAMMLASFTRVESVTIPVRVRKGLWRRYRTNDLDVESMMRYCQALDEPMRFAPYKRMADVCLFLTGMFPEYIDSRYRYPMSRQVRPRMKGRLLKNREDYEQHGRAFYRLAAEHERAKVEKLNSVLAMLAENFILAEKPLAYLANRYLGFAMNKLFVL